MMILGFPREGGVTGLGISLGSMGVEPFATAALQVWGTAEEGWADDDDD